MSDTIKKERYKGYLITVEYDDIAESPREWSPLGTMVCDHSRYKLGDMTSQEWAKREWRGDEELSPQEALQQFFNRDDVFGYPLFIYEHSGISLSCRATYPYNDRWDAGRVGFIFVTREQIISEYGDASKESIRKALKVLEREVEEYDLHLNGECYIVFVEDKDGEQIDECFSGMGDYDALVNDARKEIDRLVAKAEREAEEIVSVGPR